MIELELDKTFIKNVCDEINKSVFELESEIYKTTQKSYIKLITQSNYISKGNKKLN